MTGRFDFGTAIAAVKRGERVRRGDMPGFLFLSPASYTMARFICHATGDRHVPWTATHDDLLADDWEVIDAT